MDLYNQDNRVVYDAVRNILFNELKLNRNQIHEWIKEEVEARVDHILESHNFERYMEDATKKWIAARVQGAVVRDIWNNVSKVVSKKCEDMVINLAFKNEEEDKRSEG